jgi:hypothetical protein
MEITLKIKPYYHDIAKCDLYTVDIFINEKWFKEIGSFITISELFTAVRDNEELQEAIKGELS